MPAKKKIKSTAKKTSQKEEEEKIAEKLLKSANAAKAHLQQTSAAINASGSTSQSLTNTQQTIVKYLDNITILADKVIEMWKNNQIGTNEYKDLTVTLNNYLALARVFYKLADEQRKLLMVGF